ncbi:hypothetical protein B0H19DRAFT_313778 [Mycena capillaripes]|nr:hypothetical protein B0H19DRAFT_313778 [Mycena capillaripes]
MLILSHSFVPTPSDVSFLRAQQRTHSSVFACVPSPEHGVLWPPFHFQLSSAVISTSNYINAVSCTGTFSASGCPSRLMCMLHLASSDLQRVKGCTRTVLVITVPSFSASEFLRKDSVVVMPVVLRSMLAFLVFPRLNLTVFLSVALKWSRPRQADLLSTYR